MTDLIVEDGNGLVNANSYATVAQVSERAAWFGNTHWDLKEEITQHHALIIATRYVDTLYGDLYRGELLTNEQALLWPRTEFQDRRGRTRDQGTVPVELVDAVAVLALGHLESPLSLETDPNSNVRRRSVSVGSGAVSETVEFWDRGENTNEPRTVKLQLQNILTWQPSSQYGSAVRG